MSRRRQFQYQFRLVWKYKGQARERRLVSDSPNAILRMLRRVGTETPWMGVTPTQMRRAWAWVARRLDVPFEAVSKMGPRQALLALQSSYPALEYIRVETRQVAPWVEMLDPLHNLKTAGTEKADIKRLKLLADVETMESATLDLWRWVPDETKDAFRRRHDTNIVGRLSGGKQGTSIGPTETWTISGADDPGIGGLRVRGKRP